MQQQQVGYAILYNTALIHRRTTAVSGEQCCQYIQGILSMVSSLTLTVEVLVDAVLVSLAQRRSETDVFTVMMYISWITVHIPNQYLE